MSKDRRTLGQLLKESKVRVEAMTPEEREAMMQLQAESYARSLRACPHGYVDFEQCQTCRYEAAQERIANAKPYEPIRIPLGWEAEFGLPEQKQLAKEGRQLLVAFVLFIAGVCIAFGTLVWAFT